MSSSPAVFAARKPNQHMATASAFGLLEQEPCPALEWDFTSRVRDQTLFVCVVLLQAWSAVAFLNLKKKGEKYSPGLDIVFRFFSVIPGSLSLGEPFPLRDWGYDLWYKLHISELDLSRDHMGFLSLYISQVYWERGGDSRPLSSGLLPCV